MAIAIDRGSATMATVSPPRRRPGAAKAVAFPEDGDQLRREQLAEARLRQRRRVGAALRVKAGGSAERCRIGRHGHCRACGSLYDRTGREGRAMTKAMRIHDYGGPEAIGYEEVAVGEPGPGQMRLRHRAIGVNCIDVYFRTGQYLAPSLPLHARPRGAGEVVAVREGVAGSSRATGSPMSAASAAPPRSGSSTRSPWSRCRRGSMTRPPRR